MTDENKIINDSSKTIATTNTLVSEAVYNARRSVLMLRNTSTAGEKISIAIGKEAVSGQGIVLNQNDSISFSQDGSYYPSNDRVNAIASVATATLAIHEEIILN